MKKRKGKTHLLETQKKKSPTVPNLKPKCMKKGKGKTHLPETQKKKNPPKGYKQPWITPKPDSSPWLGPAPTPLTRPREDSGWEDALSARYGARHDGGRHS